MMDDIWSGLEDCIELLQTGRYEVLTRTEDGARFIFPITEPELHKAYLLERRRIPIKTLGDFSVRIPDELNEGYFGWRPVDDFLLHMRPNILEPPNQEEAYVGRFSYEPESQEFLPALMHIAHNTTIQRFGSHPFNEYVRGVYIRCKDLILLRAYFNPLDENGRFDPYRFYDPDMDMEKTKKTIEMLAANGLPEETTIIARANNELIRDSCLRAYIEGI